MSLNLAFSLYLSLFFGWAGPIYAGGVGTACMEKQRSLQAGLRAPLPLGQLAAKATSGYPVVLIGEHHIYSHRKIYPEFLERIRRVTPGYDCLFLEGGDNIVPAYRENVIHGMMETLKAADRLGLRIVTLEPVELGTDDERRDFQMAYVIEQSIKRGLCRGGVAIVGAAHLKTLREHLNARQVKHSSIKVIPDKSIWVMEYKTDLRAFENEGLISKIFSEQFCTEQTPALNEATGIPGRRGDYFDYFLLFPVRGI